MSYSLAESDTAWLDSCMYIGAYKWTSLFDEVCASERKVRTQGGFTIPGFKYPWHSSYFIMPVDVDS